MRCGKCAHTWFHSPSSEMEKQEISDLGALIDQINIRQKPIPKHSGLPVIKREPIPLTQKITLLTLGLIAAGLALLIMMPGMYGLPSSKGLVLADVGIVRVVDKDNHASFQLNGKIANMTAGNIKMPALRITLVDSEGNSLQYWNFLGDIPTIEAHKDVPFATGNLDIRFSSGKRFVAEIGNSLELALRRKPEPMKPL